MLNNMEHTKKSQYTIKNFLPLIIIYSIIIFFTGVKQYLYGFDIHNAMYDFMGVYFIVFSLFKIINLKGFAEAYSTYDIIAKRFRSHSPRNRLHGPFDRKTCHAPLKNPCYVNQAGFSLCARWGL